MEQIAIFVILSLIILVTIALMIVKIINYISERRAKKYKKYYAGKITMRGSADISVDDDIKIAKENNYKSFNS